ncbi:MAG: AraC family transcriptional regulator [Bacteroidaceae bacterium]|nr:AraC family transcriptional regulator [Bacteroidaceae bacterium]
MDKKDTHRRLIDSLLIRKKRYRDPNYSAKQLSEELGVSASQLSRILKEEYAMGYTDIVHLYRIQEAMHHLKDQRFAPYSIDDIGTLVGFKNRQSFFTAFKKVSGTTPEKYRLENTSKSKQHE